MKCAAPFQLKFYIFRKYQLRDHLIDTAKLHIQSVTNKDSAQWRIQNFLDGVANTKGGANLLFNQITAKLHENEEN